MRFVQPGVGFLDLFDQMVDAHPLQRAVQRARPKPDPAVGDPLDVGHQHITVPVAFEKRQQQGEDSGRKRLVRGDPRLLWR
jgi:hypothetical protein